MKQGKLIVGDEPVGVKIFGEADNGFLSEIPVYHGISYCEAVSLASEGREFVVQEGSIEVCKWAPAVLGFKKPDDEFSSNIEPRLEYPVSRIYLAPLSMFESEPDVVIIRGEPSLLEEISGRLGEDAIQKRYFGAIGKSAVGLGGGMSLSVGLTRFANRVLSSLGMIESFRRLTYRLFKSEKVTAVFERLIKGAMADMSVCRNSTVIPYLEDAGNISFFCVGGITWGGNKPWQMTCGFPKRYANDLREMLEWHEK
ncbi:MAG: DUF169 domain-containing protein [Actinomycetota bacterium]|nr:DUF169 domain-containing protein [Actinomycetota bacterium]